MAIQQVDLVGNSGRPVVTPQATEQLTDAFRKGFVTADDIMERVSERTRAKQELELVTANQGIAEATDPALIEAKKNQQLAAGAQAKSALTLNPLAEQAKTAELKAAIFDAQAKPGGFSLMQEALSKAGFPVSIDANLGLTDANKNEIIKRFSALQTYALKRADAEDRVKNTETKFFPTEQKLPDGSTTKGQLQKLFRNGQEVTSDEFKNWATEAEALKRTPFSQWYSLQATQPGQVATPAPVAAPAIVISPAEAAQQRAQLFNQGVPNAASLTDQEVSVLIQPRAAAPVAAAAMPVITPTLGQTSPGLGIVTSVEAAGPAKPPTESAGRSGSFAGRMASAENQITALTASGFDPTGAVSSIQRLGPFPEGIKSDTAKSFETAKLQWITALLRRESGAAVPRWELDTYEKAFFPVFGDGPTNVAQKAAVRQQAMQSLIQEAEGLRTFVPPTTPTIPTPGASEQTTVIGGKTYLVKTDPTTGQKRYFVRQ